MAGEEVPWPRPPREPGPWNGGAPVAPPGNTPLPPLPGTDGVVHDAHAQANPWSGAAAVPRTGGPPAGPGAPVAAPPAGSGRAPAWLLVVAAVVVLAVLVGTGYVLLFGGRQYPSEWDSRAASIAEWVAEERQLEFEHPVRVNFLTDEEYSELSTAGIDPDTEEAAEFYADQAAQLRALGFLAGEVDLAVANETLSDSGTLAYYDPANEQVFVRGTELTPALRVTLAHELTHVLQDQHFDLERLTELDDGRGPVLRALAEGDAGAIEDEYVAQMSEEDQAAYREESRSGAEDAAGALEADVPPIMRTLFASPYILGPELIALLEVEDGQRAIDERLADPPSEEALFNPLLLDSDQLIRNEVEAEAPEGVDVVERDEFGPTALYLLLATRLDPKVALAAVDGWGGDEYVVYEDDDRVCIALWIQGDDAEATATLTSALEDWATRSPEGVAEVTTADPRVTLRACDPGPEAEAIGDAAPDLLGLPTGRTFFYGQALAAGQGPDVARCFATTMIERLAPDQLTGTFIQSEDGQAVIGAVFSGCGS